jgi:hypothetical protein
MSCKFFIISYDKLKNLKYSCETCTTGPTSETTNCATCPRNKNREDYSRKTAVIFYWFKFYFKKINKTCPCSSGYMDRDM